MAKISWGKPKIYVRRANTNDNFVLIPTPMDGTTELTTEKGEKLEALIEGGEAEAVKFKANKYSLAYSIRRAKDRTLPFEDVNGVVAEEFEVIVVPEDPTAPGLRIAATTVSIEESYNTTEGGYITVTHEAVLPESGKRMLNWGTYSVSGKVFTYDAPADTDTDTDSGNGTEPGTITSVVDLSNAVNGGSVNSGVTIDPNVVTRVVITGPAEMKANEDSVQLTATVYPTTAAYDSIGWFLSGNAGVNAKLEATGNTCTVNRPVGVGETVIKVYARTGGVTSSAHTLTIAAKSTTSGDSE